VPALVTLKAGGARKKPFLLFRPCSWAIKVFPRHDVPLCEEPCRYNFSSNGDAAVAYSCTQSAGHPDRLRTISFRCGDVGSLEEFGWLSSLKTNKLRGISTGKSLLYAREPTWILVTKRYKQCGNVSWYVHVVPPRPHRVQRQCSGRKSTTVRSKPKPRHRLFK